LILQVILTFLLTTLDRRQNDRLSRPTYIGTCSRTIINIHTWVVSTGNINISPIDVRPINFGRIDIDIDSVSSDV
jgi:hypothetical protein